MTEEILNYLQDALSGGDDSVETPAGGFMNVVYIVLSM